MLCDDVANIYRLAQACTAATTNTSTRPIGKLCHRIDDLLFLLALPLAKCCLCFQRCNVKIWWRSLRWLCERRH